MQTVRTHHSRVGVGENEDKWRTDSPSGTVQGRGGEWVPLHFSEEDTEAQDSTYQVT